MMRKYFTARYLIIGSIILLVFIVAVVNLTRRSIQERTEKTEQSKLIPTPSIQISALDKENIRPLTNTLLPIKNENVEIDYSLILRKFYVWRKTPEGQNEAREFFRSRNIKVTDADVIYVNSDVYSNIIKDEYKVDSSVPAPETTSLDHQQ